MNANKIFMMETDPVSEMGFSSEEGWVTIRAIILGGTWQKRPRKLQTNQKTYHVEDKIKSDCDTQYGGGHNSTFLNTTKEMYLKFYKYN
jgi:hypothetical protein